MRPGNHVLDGGPDPPIGRGNFEGKKGFPIVKYRDIAVICAKTAEPIEMPYGLWARMDHRNRVGWRSSGAEGRCYSRGGFLGSSYPMKT